MHKLSSPSERVPPGPPPGPSTPSPGPEFHPLIPPSSTPGTTPVSPPELRPDRATRCYVYWSQRNWEEYQELRRLIEKRRLVGSAGRGRVRGKAGGRPPVGDATLQELLEAYRWKQRVWARAVAPRQVDEAAVRSLRILFAPHPFGWLAPFPALDRVVVQTFPSYRPPRRLHVIAGFCENGLLRPTWKYGEEWIVEDASPPPTRVPEYRYLRGNLGPRPLDQEVMAAV